MAGQEIYTTIERLRDAGRSAGQSDVLQLRADTVYAGYAAGGCIRRLNL